MKVYVIYNEIAKQPVSEPFCCSDHATACFSFNGFLNKTCKPELGIKDTIFTLYYIADYNPEDLTMVTVENEIVAAGREEANNVIQAAVDSIDER